MIPQAAQAAPAPAILALHERLLASASATAVLREMFGDPVAIERRAGFTPPGAPLLDRLLVHDPAEIKHRRVRLHAAGRPVSEADLWYVPARLWPGMAQTLDCTSIPFGAVVAPMQPGRETITFRFWGPAAPYALEHQALLRDGNDLPVAFVHEYYFQI